MKEVVVIARKKKIVIFLIQINVLIVISLHVIVLFVSGEGEEGVQDEEKGRRYLFTPLGK